MLNDEPQATAIGGGTIGVGTFGGSPHGAWYDNLRIIPLEVNQPPTASLSISPETELPKAGETITFDASGSSDPDGSIASFEWDFGGGGDFEESGETVSHSFMTGGQKTVTLQVTDDEGATDTVSQTFTVWREAVIDIKPGSNQNPINPDSKGNTPVAMLHADGFDPVARIDVSSLRFGAPGDGHDELDKDADASPAHGGHVEDVDDDGDDDLMLHFPTRDTAFEKGDEMGRLLGETTDQPPVPVVGNDDVKIVGGGKDGGNGNGNNGNQGNDGGGRP